MSHGRIKYVSSDAEFRNELTNAKDKPVVVDFFATWCGPCKALERPFEELANKYTNAIFLKVDVDRLSQTAAQAQIRAMPTIQVYKNGNKVGEVVGLDLAGIDALIAKHHQQSFSAFGGSGRTLGGGSSASVPPYMQDRPAVRPAPQQQQQQPKATDEEELDEETAMAIALSIQEQNQKKSQPTPATTTTTTTASTPAGATATTTTDVTMTEAQAQPQQEGGEYTLPEGVNIDTYVLDSLAEMGFSKLRSAKALLALQDQNQPQSIEGAIAWLEAHQDDADIDAPIQPRKELTPEEREAQARAAREKALELQRQARLKIQEAEKKAAIEQEKNRIKSQKEAQKANELYKEQQRKREIEELKAQKKKDKEDKARLLKQLEADKAERRAKKLAAQGITTTETTPAAAAAATTATTGATASASSAAPAPKKEYTECELQIRQTDGKPLRLTFKPTDTIATVRDAVAKQRTDGGGAFRLMSNFPRKVYDGAELKKTLQEEGLVPRGALIITK